MDPLLNVNWSFIVLVQLTFKRYLFYTITNCQLLVEKIVRYKSDTALCRCQETLQRPFGIEQLFVLLYKQIYGSYCFVK